MGRTEIGAALRDARRRNGMDVREVEERTKIRARYIRALENEDWETLPAPAYVRGFLRTYGQLLGFDGEMLADEYRRRYGDTEAAASPAASEPLLSESRRIGGSTGPSRLALAGAALGVVIVLLVLLGLLGGEDDGGSADRPAGGKQARKQAQQAQGGGGSNRAKNGGGGGGGGLEPTDAKLTALTSVEVCLLAGSQTALVDNQVLAEGRSEEYSDAKRYRLTFNAGAVRFQVGDNRERLEVSDPASFIGDSKGIRETDYRGPGCP